MDGYVSKPLRADELFATIDALCPPEDGGAGAAGASEPHPPRTVNLDGLLAGFGGNSRLVREVVDVFLQDAPAMVSRLRAAASACDPTQIAAAAHAIKGAAGLFSQGQAYESSRRLEQYAKAGDRSAIDAACADVEADISQLMTELRDLRGGLA
jgi:HPt (histidine-containing phosphotransfer) domain-containing protein